MASLGLTPDQRTRILNITACSLARAASAGQTPAAFFQTVADSARSLALDLVPLESALRAISACQQIASEIWSQHPDLRVASAHLQTSIQLAVTQAWRAVEIEESRLMERVLVELDERDDLDDASYAEAVLAALRDHFDWPSAALFHERDDMLQLIASTPGTPDARPARAAVVRPLRTRARVLDAADPLEAPQILIPAWRQADAPVWSVPVGALLLQSVTPAPRIAARDEQVIRRVLLRAFRVLARMRHEQVERDQRARMLDVEELERRRVARELHDDAGQSLVVMRLQLEMAELGLPPDAEALRSNLAEIRKIMEQTIIGVRRLISDLSPAVLQQLGLAAAVRQLTNRFRENYPGRVRLHISKAPTLDSRTEMVVYRLLQEAYANISQHSRAKNVNVSMTSTDRTLRLTVEDDGQGFLVSEGLGRRNCFGLLGIQERIRLAGGHLEISSTPSSPSQGKAGGTKLSVELPIS